MSKKPTLKELEQKVAELTDALQRERADAVNVKRRAEEDKNRMGDFYKVMIMRDLLPALDNLELALKHVPSIEGEGIADSEKRIGKESETSPFTLNASRLGDYVKGIQGVAKQFDDCFAKLGIERIKTVGEPFDPRLHEAISVEDAGGTVEVVCEELQPGYKLGDEIIRHALVKVKMSKSKKG